MIVRKKVISFLAVFVGLSVVTAPQAPALVTTSDCKVILTGPVVINYGDSVFSITGNIQDSEGIPIGELRQTETPASGCNDLCDGLPGAQYGLCNAYCEAMDCDSEVPMANPIACGKVLENFKNKSGGTPPPCETCEKTFVAENIDSLFCWINGGNIGVVSGTGYWNGAGPYRFDLTVEADTIFYYDFTLRTFDGATILWNISGEPVSGTLSVTLP